MTALPRLLGLWLLVGWFALMGAHAAHALAPIDINTDADRIELAPLGVPQASRGDELQIETARAADGTIGRMAVRAATPGTQPRWFVFALTNPTDKPAERWLVAERYNHVGSGIMFPDLDTRRLEAVTPSLGFVPERLPYDNSDAFRLSIEPGQTVTFAVEIVGDRIPRMQLWRGLDYEKRNRNRQLFNGILLGMTGLLALFLTVIFAANHKAIFPAAALFTWSVLAYLCVDFGFWHKLFNVRPEENATYRAAGEALMALSLLVFSSTFLRLFRWHAFVRMLFGLATLALIALFALAFLDPRLAATFARLSLVGVLLLASLATLYLAVLRQDRALAIVPTWILFAVWLFGAGLVLTGRLGSDIIVNGLIAGLVLLTILIGFTVTQFAFRTVDAVFGGSPSDQQLRALAVDGTGAAVFDFNAARDEIRLGPQINAALGLEAAERQEPVAKFVQRLHSADRERLIQTLSALRDRATGMLEVGVRMRHLDGSYRWFDIEASTLPATDRGKLRAVGLMRETTDQRRAQERLLQDAVTDTLTNLPNRALFLDRLGTALIRARSEPLVRPLVIFIDLDKFRAVNQAVGLVVGDSLLIAVARRLQRLAHGTDTLARLGGDRFGLLIIGARDEREQRMLAEDVRAAIKAPIVINGQEIVLTGSIGLAQHEPRYPSTASDLVANAEAAMLRARRSGPDRIESFQASAADQHNPAAELNDELAAALERRQIKVHFRPIVHLHTEGLAGFEACARWEHPRLGLVDPMRLDVPDGPVALRLGATLVQAAAAEVQRWRKEFDRPTQPLFVCLDIGRASLRGPELVQEVRHLIQRGGLAKGALRLEVAETLVMDNPEQANETLLALTQAGARVVLDDFGAGYSSLSYLAQFPIDGIKIDAGLVAAATRSAAGTAIVRSIVALAHELGKTVVADGVDGEDMVGLLRTIGCDMAQGDYYGPVTPAREAMQRVKQERRSDRRNQRSGLFRLRPKRSEADGTDVAVTAGEAGPADGEAMGRLTGKRPAAPMAAAARRPSPATPVAAPPSANGTTGLERPAAPLPPQTPVYVPRPEIRASANHAVEEADRTLARLKEQMARSVAAQPPQPPSPARAEPQPALTASQPSLTDMLAARVQSTSPPAAAPPAAPMPPQALPMPAVAPAAAAPAAPPLPATQPAPPLAPRPAAPPIDLSGLPPAIAASMAKLAQQKPPPRTGSD